MPRLIPRSPIPPAKAPLWLVILRYRVRREWEGRELKGTVGELGELKRFIDKMRPQRHDPYDHDCRLFTYVSEGIDGPSLTIYRESAYVQSYEFR